MDALPTLKSSAEKVARQVWGGFALRGVRQPLGSRSRFFDILSAWSLAVIDTVMRDESVDIDRKLISYYASLYVSSGEPSLSAVVCQRASRIRRDYGDAEAHHSTQNTQHHTRTYQHQQLTHKQSNAPQNQSRTSRSMAEGGDGVLRGARVQDASLTGCTSHRSKCKR